MNFSFHTGCLSIIFHCLNHCNFEDFFENPNLVLSTFTFIVLKFADPTSFDFPESFFAIPCITVSCISLFLIRLFKALIL